MLKEVSLSMLCIETLASLQVADPELLNRIITIEAYPNDAAKLRQQFLERFRYRMIGSCNTEEWEQVVTDTADGLAWIWNQIFDGVRTQQLGDFADRSYEITTTGESENLPDIPVEGKKYLSNKNKTDQKGKFYDTANMASIKGILANVADPYEEWCKEFDDYFLNRLGDCPYDL